MNTHKTIGLIAIVGALSFTPAIILAYQNRPLPAPIFQVETHKEVKTEPMVQYGTFV